MLAAYCHAVRVRLTGPVDVVLPVRLWVEEVPAAADDVIAERVRAAELARPVNDLRCVLLEYTDGVADLVVVAHRARYDVAGLRALLTGGVRVESTYVPSVAAEAPDWGFGGVHGWASTSVAVTESGTEDTWSAALSTTVELYGASDGLVGLWFTDEVLGSEYVPCLAPAYPLTISVSRTESGWSLRGDFLSSHFAPAIAVQFLRHLAHVHHQVLIGGEPSLLDGDELARVVALGQSKVVADEPMRIPEAFARIVAEVPDALALSDRDIRLSYRELDERSTLLASGLRAAGVRDGDRVVICLERSAQLVVALLGVLKAGAVYVPADPVFPPERLAYVVEDAAPAVVITTLPDFPAAETTTPDALISAASGAVSSTITPSDPAYVIYTSGSTGRPKGVVIPHRNVLSLVNATQDEYGLGTGEVWSFFHSSAFDFSVWEIWGCLLTGGRLVVVPYFDAHDPERFRELLVTEGVTVLSQTPSAFNQLLDTDHADIPVRLVVLGGEPLDARMLLPWFDRHPESTCRVVNMFGITETTVHVTAQTMTRALALASSRSVGRALPGWHLYVLDPDGRPLPPGIAGEIHVGGVGVASHYLNRDDLTAQRFVSDPFTGGSMYRSGDLGRFRPDGTLEHLGRIDSQVKIRGYRIELDEIRAVLLEATEVRAAAVIVGRADPADPASARIDSYVVLSGGSTAGIRERAAKVLPGYMVPATVTELSRIPLTDNGKLDPAQLPEPVLSAKPAAPAAADDDLAASLAELWGEVLGVPVGVDDDFFELGGNSLFAVRLGSAMRARGLPALRLRELYRNPTVRAVTAILTSATDPVQPAI